MASIRKHKLSKFWYACITLPTGKQVQFSTGLTDKTEALAAAISAERTTRINAGQPSQLHLALAKLADQFAPREDTEPVKWLEAWLARKAGTIASDTRRLYAGTIADFKAYATTHGLTSWSAVTPRHAEALRNELAAKQTAATVNAKTARLAACWAAAMAEGQTHANPWKGLKSLRATATARREFRPHEVEALLGAVSGPWRAMVLLGLWTGQRISDLASLRWSNVDLAAGTIRFTAQKTRTLVSIPLVQAVVDSLTTDTQGGDAPDAFLFPTLAALSHQARSDRFRAILESLGLADPRRQSTREDKGKRARSSRRRTAPLSFHSLRHTFTTRLKSAGVSDSIARAIVGHKSAAVSNNYTHLDMDTMRRAILAAAANK